MKLSASFKLKPGYEYIKSGVVKEGDFVVYPASANPEYAKWHPAEGLIDSPVNEGIVGNTSSSNTWLACRKIAALVPKEGCEFVKKGGDVRLGDFVTNDMFWGPAAGLVGHEVGTNGRVKDSLFNKLSNKWYVCRPIPVAPKPAPKVIKITVEIEGKVHSFSVTI